MFRDLFERQGYEDDGVFDWDLRKKTEQLCKCWDDCVVNVGCCSYIALFGLFH